MNGTLRFIRSHAEAGIRQWKLSRMWRAFIAQHPLAPDEIGLLVREGIGDHFIVAALAEELAARHHCRIRLCGNPRYAFLQKLFPSVSSYLCVSDTAKLDPVANRRVQPGHYVQAFFPADPSLVRAQGHNGFHMVDGYRCHLDLPGDARPSLPLPPNEIELARATHLLDSHHLPAGRTVLLCIDARTIPSASIPAGFWASLATGLVSRGLQPVVSRGPTTPELPGVPGLDVSLEDFRAVATVAGGVCALRSGLADLAADLPALRAVIYPRMACGGGTLGEVFTLQSLGYPNHVGEFTIDGDYETSLPSLLNMFH